MRKTRRKASVIQAGYGDSGVLRVAAYMTLLTAALLLSACNRVQLPAISDDYVEIDNPFYSGSPVEEPKIWVPKSSLGGLPRGGEVARKGYRNLTASAAKPEQEKSIEGLDGVRQRIFIASDLGAGVERRVSLFLKGRFTVRPAVTSEPAIPVSAEERTALAGRVANEPGGGLLLILSGRESAKVGGIFSAELYDGRGPLLLRTFTVKVSPPDNDETIEESIERAIFSLAAAIADLAGQLPWFGRVISVSGNRIYFDAGSASGLKVGQKLNVFRGGETVKLIGFASGERIASVQLVGLVGPDGSFAETVDSGKVKPGDYVELEK